MAKTTAILFCLLTLRFSYGFNGDSFELECPDECDCHYFRINWVTDCSESNLTTIPYDELSLSVYILDLNGNNITSIQPFPNAIKMRRLQIANNRLTRVDKDSFRGLDYLIDVDLSGNNISYVDPEAFLWVLFFFYTFIKLYNFNSITFLVSDDYVSCNSRYSDYYVL